MHAIDYLLKPYSADRFRTAISRARHRLLHRSHDAGLAALVEDRRRRPEYLARLAVVSRGRTILIDAASIDWIQAADNYVTVHIEGREHLVRETLAVLERQLDPDRFARIHRSAIVNVSSIREIRTLASGDCEVHLNDGTRLAMSRGYRAALEKALGRPLP